MAGAEGAGAVPTGRMVLAFLAAFAVLGGVAYVGSVLRVLPLGPDEAPEEVASGTPSPTPSATPAATRTATETAAAPPLDICDETSDAPPSGARRLPDWRPPAQAVPHDRGYLYLDSEPNDFFGDGPHASRLLYSMGCQASTFGKLGRTHHFTVDGELDWDLQVQYPASDGRLEVGTYDNVTSPSSAGDRAGIEVHSGHACGSGIRAKFIVDDAAYDADGHLARLSLRFEQHCGGNPAALMGEFRWDAGA